MLDGIQEVVAAKRGKSASFDARAVNARDEAMLGLILGPTGNLRAPTLRVGTRLLIGFDAAMYTDFFGLDLGA